MTATHKKIVPDIIVGLQQLLEGIPPSYPEDRAVIICILDHAHQPPSLDGFLVFDPSDRTTFQAMLRGLDVAELRQLAFAILLRADAKAALSTQDEKGD